MRTFSRNLPKACKDTTNKEQAVSLDKRGQEGEEAVGGHADEEALSAAHFVRHSSPEERSNHHPQVNHTAWKIGGEKDMVFICLEIQYLTCLLVHMFMRLYVLVLPIFRKFLIGHLMRII